MVLVVNRIGDDGIVLTGSKDHYIKVRSQVKVTVVQGHSMSMVRTPGDYNGTSCRWNGGNTL